MSPFHRLGRRMPAAGAALIASAATILTLGPSLAGTGPVAGAAAGCPWTLPSGGTPQVKAVEVLSLMTTAEKASYVALTENSGNGYENYIPAIPRLCLPSLRLQDGPAGVSYGASGVTALPAPIALAASWDPGLATKYGTVLGQEFRSKGIQIAQTPILNLARTPQGGRDFEGFGEDPSLVSSIADPEIEAIQGQGVVAQAKHLVANDQETHRRYIDEQISQRVLHELYLPPFQSAVQVAHVGSMMCAFNKINSVYACQSSQLLQQTLRRDWGFRGFVRSDQGAVHDIGAALSAGDNLVKPTTPDKISAAVAAGQIPLTVLNAAVEPVLETMFRFNLVGNPLPERLAARAATGGHRGTAAHVAEAGTVLLQNNPVRGHPVLPLSGADRRSIAVIGRDAWSQPQLSGGGSSYVFPGDVSTPLQALAGAAPSGAQVRYAAGAPYHFTPVPVPSQVLTTSNGSAHGLTETIYAGAAHPDVRHVGSVNADFGTQSRPKAPASATPGAFHVTWQGNVVANRTGAYDVALHSDDGGTFSVNGKLLRSRQSGNLAPVRLFLVAGRAVPFEVTYTDRSPGGSAQLVWGPARDPGSSQAQAAQLAARSRVAIVFASNASSEGSDRHGLELPGDQDRLIERVAARNPRTVVVLHTAGPVLMPWLHKVAAVVQAWYPGEVDGVALERVLTGAFDPSGRLPMTFPTSAGRTPTSDRHRWPGVNGVIDYGEGLDLGYRWYAAHRVRPLFPFGFGLSYTRFRLSRLSVQRVSSGGADVSVTVRNVGHRLGSTVPQVYLHYPRSAQEPPIVLRSFRKVTVRPGRSARVTMRLPAAAFAYWNATTGMWLTAGGTYQVRVGDSSADLPLHANVPSTWVKLPPTSSLIP